MNAHSPLALDLHRAHLDRRSRLLDVDQLRQIEHASSASKPGKDEIEKRVAEIVAEADRMIACVRSRWINIALEVCKKHGVSIEEILGQSRFARITSARHELAYRLKHELHLSYVSIGRRMGGRDHTTIINSVRKHALRLQEEAAE